MYSYCGYYGTWGIGSGVHVVVKFVFIAACLTVALVSFVICKSRRDWLWLVLGLGFTLGADYFLILHNLHLAGVAVFCFAHMAYIMRATSASQQGPRQQGNPGVSWSYAFLDCFASFANVNGGYWRLVPLFAVPVVMVAFFTFNIYLVTGLYAALFITNIYVSARYIRHNRVLVIAGLLLFAACDICVFIFNLPHYLGAPRWLAMVFPLIWVFYLPAQALLAVSAVDFSAKRRAAFLT